MPSDIPLAPTLADEIAFVRSRISRLEIYEAAGWVVGKELPAMRAVLNRLLSIVPDGEDQS